MIEIQLKQIPNQALSIDIEGNTFNITIKTTDAKSTIADISINSNAVIKGIRCMPNRPIIPYKYLEQGNFFFATMDDEYPYYTSFGTTQRLVYLSTSELGTLRA